MVCFMADLYEIVPRSDLQRPCIGNELLNVKPGLAHIQSVDAIDLQAFDFA